MKNPINKPLDLKSLISAFAELMREKPLVGIALAMQAFHFYFLYLAAQALQAPQQNFQNLTEVGLSLSAASIFVLLVVAWHRGE